MLECVFNTDAGVCVCVWAPPLTHNSTLRGRRQNHFLPGNEACSKYYLHPASPSGSRKATDSLFPPLFSFSSFSFSFCLASVGRTSGQLTPFRILR